MELWVCLPVLGHVLVGAVEEHGEEEEAQQLQCGGNSVGKEAANTAPNAAGDENAFDDRGQARLSKHNVGSGLGSISSTENGNAHISTLQCRRVIYTIASHAHPIAELTKYSTI